MTRKLRVIDKDWHTKEREANKPVPQAPMRHAHATQFWTVKETAERLRVSWDTIYRLISEKRLWAQPSGNRYLIPESAIQDYFEAERKRKLRA